jgi:trans-aconitate methyltransferase
MRPDYRARLFSEYDRRVASLDPAALEKEAWFRAYVHQNYAPHLRNLEPASAPVLDIGCSAGFLLSILKEDLGFHVLYGIDLSPADVVAAQARVPDAQIECADASDYLRTHESAFDLVVMKAVLEHVPKADVMGLLTSIHSALKPGGIALIDVPNMDWLFASHERYMDFTHEVGFTRESLHQTVGSVFARLEVMPVESVVDPSRLRVRQRVARWVLTTLMTWADPEGAANPIWARSLLAVGYR